MYTPSSLVKSPSQGQKLWRYTDLGKFVSLLDKKALFFASVAVLDDPYEGAQPEAAITELREFIASLRPEARAMVPPDVVSLLTWAARDNARDWGVSCWHCNDGESAAMWDLYATHDSGIAIQSTFERLCDSFNRAAEPQLIGMVRYTDYLSDQRILTGTIEPVMTKRKNFEHERELRALVYPLSKIKERSGESERLPGTYVPVDLARLIDTVFVAPRAPAWFVEVVRAVVGKFGPACSVQQSSLYTGPLY